MKPQHIYTFLQKSWNSKDSKNVKATTIFWKSSRSYLQFVIGMAEKGQTEANCNLENPDKIANKVGERRE